MDTSVLDLDYLYEIADREPTYIYEVITLYLDNVPVGLTVLESLVTKGDDYLAIQKQAHFLKSSASIIKIKGMYENLTGIEAAARLNAPIDEIVKKMAEITTNFSIALPMIIAERDKNHLLVNPAE